LNPEKSNLKEEVDYLQQLSLKMDKVICYLHILSLAVVRNFAKEILNSDEKIKVYLACDGRSGIREISRKLNMPHQTVSNYVKKFERCGLVHSRVYKRIKCPEKLYDLNELGLRIEEKTNER